MARRTRGSEPESGDVAGEGFEIDSDDSFTVEGPEEDRLPWLEAVEEDDEREGPSALKLIAAVIIGLAAIAVIVGGLFWLGNRDRADGNGELIAAPAGDYKVRPENPGGMNPEGVGDAAYAASAGQEPQARLNPGAVPEPPVTRAEAGDAAGPQPLPARPEPPQPRQQAAALAAGGATIQLGAFSSQASANRAWRALSGRFSYLAPLSHSVIPVAAGGRTLYRLRASGPGAADICRRLRIAGEDCTPVG